jgi:hypothetical protein
VNVNFTPLADICTNPNNPIIPPKRAFGDEPKDCFYSWLLQRFVPIDVRDHFLRETLSGSWGLDMTDSHLGACPSSISQKKH